MTQNTEFFIERLGADWYVELGDYTLNFASRVVDVAVLRNLYMAWQQSTSHPVSWYDLEHVINRALPPIPLMTRLFTSHRGRYDRVMYFVEGLRERLGAKCFGDWRIVQMNGKRKYDTYFILRDPSEHAAPAQTLKKAA